MKPHEHLPEIFSHNLLLVTGAVDDRFKEERRRAVPSRETENWLVLDNEPLETDSQAQSAAQHPDSPL